MRRFTDTAFLSTLSLFVTRARRLLPLVCALLFGIGGVAVTPDGAAAQDTLAVNSLGDLGDDSNDGICSTGNTVNNGNAECTLRAAVEEANRDTDRDRITFGKLTITNGADTIGLGSELPVTEEVDLDATTGSGYSTPGPPVIVLTNDGMNAGEEALDIGGNADGSLIQGLNVVGGEDAALRIAASGVDVRLCYLGVQRNGGADPNLIGIEIEGSASNVTIGGAQEEGLLTASGRAAKASSFSDLYRNVIAGNESHGVIIRSDNNEVGNNLIGVADDSTTAVANGGHGVLVTGRDNDVGFATLVLAASTGKSTGDAAGNVISGNGGAGVRLAGPNNALVENHIGTDGAGTQAVPNDQDGIQVRSDSNGVVNNVISGNARNGIVLGTSGTSADASNIVGNTIGLNADQNAPLPNGESVSPSAGIACRQSKDTGSNKVTTLNDNVIAGNAEDGIAVRGTCREWTVTRNYVGTTPGGAVDLGNGRDGIRLVGNGASVEAFRIGYSAFASFTDPEPSEGGNGNVIARNSETGIVVGTDRTSTDVSSVSIRGNAVYENGSLGLDLAGNGLTGNDSRDTDDGPNRRQNFPDIQTAEYDPNADEVTVTYAVPSDPGASTSGASNYGQNGLRVDFYRAGAADEQGRAYLGTDTYAESDYNTSTSGPDDKTVTFTPSNAVSRTDKIVATATDESNNTSEFSVASSPLPVELTSFDGTQIGDRAVELTWTTASEQNNAGFRVQHRASGEESWTKLGYVESKASGGTTTEAKTYRFTAEELGVGTHEFRLKQMDLDGTAHLHDAVSVELQMQEALQLTAPAPNPVQSQSQVAFAVRDQAEATIAIYNTLGQKVGVLYRGTPPAGQQQTLQVSADNLASGVYVLRLEAEGKTETRRMTVVQ